MTSAVTRNAAPAVQAKGIRKGYSGQKQPVLDEFSLSVLPGEFFGLLGPNGAGKTTVLSILSGLRRADYGQITVFGEDFGPRHPLHARIGIVPQDIALYDRLSGRENLQFFGRLLGLASTRLTERVTACLAVAQLSGRADDLTGCYSGGMQRRLNLAIALLGEPVLLFLDEPTVGVDTQSRHAIHQELRRLHQQGVTIIYTTHYMEEAQELCSRVAILDRGCVISDGPPSDLRAASGCANLEELFLQLTGKRLRDT